MLPQLKSNFLNEFKSRTSWFKSGIGWGCAFLVEGQGLGRQPSPEAQGCQEGSGQEIILWVQQL